MILSEIKYYFQMRKQASLEDLAAHFDSNPSSMRNMLEHFVRKGKVIKSKLRTGCGRGCSSCRCEAVMELYEWRP